MTLSLTFTQVVEPPLPEGWAAHVTTTRPGQTYYYHKASKTTTWKRPTEEDVMVCGGVLLVICCVLPAQNFPCMGDESISIPRGFVYTQSLYSRMLSVRNGGTIIQTHSHKQRASVAPTKPASMRMRLPSCKQP